MTNQGNRHQSFRDISGTSLDYNGDSYAAFIADGASGDTYNGAFISWLQIKLTSTDDNLPNLMQAFAESQGASSWDEMGTF